LAQAAPKWKMELFADAHMSSCAISYNAPGIMQIHVFHTGDEPSAGSVFALYPPPCLVGAIWLTDVVIPPFLSLLSTQNQHGLHVAYAGCQSLPAYIGYVNFWVTDNSVSCCEFLVADPVHPSTGLDAVACDLSTLFHVEPGRAIINETLNCPCQEPVAVEETTWGQIKALYR